MKIVVGYQEETFYVHENLIRASSPFFDKALSCLWQDSAQKTIQLPDDEPHIVAIYVSWLYHGTLPVFSNETRHSAEYLIILKAYTFGDKVLDTRFKNTAICALIEKSTTLVDGKQWYSGISAIEYVYSNTSESAIVRKLLVDMFVMDARDSWFQQWEEEGSIPKAFLFDFAYKLLGRQGRPRPDFRASDYRIHDSKNVEARPDKKGF